MKWVNVAAELFLGATCSGCQAPSLRLCSRCAAKLVAQPMLIRRPSCEWLETWVGATYEAEIARIILAWKDGVATQLTRPLARSLAVVICGSGFGPSTLVPVPSDPRAVRRRGFDHTASLAKAVSKLMGAPWVTRKLLSHRGAAVDQVGLTWAQRLRNAEGRYLAAVGAEPVILVDDVVTTGATLDEAANMLCSSGHQVVGAVCLAHTPKRLNFGKTLPQSGRNY